MADIAAHQIDPRALAFVVARRTGSALPMFPGAMPQTEAEAYAIQDDARVLWSEPVIGWKVGLIQPPHDAALGRTRLFGPIFKSKLMNSVTKPLQLACIAGGFAAVEAEYVLRLGADALPSTSWSLPQAAALVDAVFVGVEFAGSPFPGINDHGPLVTVADFGNNAGLILGTRIGGGVAALDAERCSMVIDGQSIGEGGANTIPGGPVSSLVELLCHMGRRGEILPKGTLVSTGAATGVHTVSPGQTALVNFGRHGRIAVEMVTDTPC